eukprot:TRINITY_DN2261_c0_g1_i1.p1 TRINITY_DN2261_c0_g1~~TRINITY_DN2261_c0_g1_i1.p1  ORF type:complete len:245 (+),score=56.08 TRINITY_DN2261_c0_g1_i1:106-840(+)
MAGVLLREMSGFGTRIPGGRTHGKGYLHLKASITSFSSVLARRLTAVVSSLLLCFSSSVLLPYLYLILFLFACVGLLIPECLLPERARENYVKWSAVAEVGSITGEEEEEESRLSAMAVEEKERVVDLLLRPHEDSPGFSLPSEAMPSRRKVEDKTEEIVQQCHKALQNIEDHLVALLFLSALNYSSLLASSSPSSSSSSSSSINLCKEGLCYIFHAMEQAPRKPWPRAWEIADTEWKQQQFSE